MSSFGAINWGERLRPLLNVWLGAGLLAALAGILIVLLNPGFAVRELSDMLQRRADLQLAASSARFQFFPQPALSLQGVRLTAADGSGYQPMTAEAIAVPISFRSLLTRKLEPATVKLENPVFNILIDANGQTGWSAKGDALDLALAQKSEPGEALTVATSGGTIKFLDERSGQAFQLQQAGLEMKLSRTGAADIEGTAAIAEQFARIEMHVASLPRLAEGGSPADLLVEAPAIEASFSGLLNLRGGLSMAGTFAAGSDSGSRLAEWMGLQKLSRIDFQELRMSGPLLLQDGTFRSSDVMLRLGGTEMKGELSLATAQRPLLRGKLSASRLSLPRATRTDSMASAPGWSTAPLNLQWANDIDLDLTLEALSIAWRRMVLGPAELHLRSEEGTFKAQLERTAAYGGTAEAQLTLKSTGNKLAADLRLSGEQMDLGQLTRETGILSVLSGRGGFAVEATAEGNSIEEMISTLAGDASISVTDGNLANIDVPASIAAAAGGERQGWVSNGGSTELLDAEASFRLKDGIATSEDMKAKVAGVNLGAQGEIDLLRRALNIEVQPRGKTDALAIRAFGPWENPKLSAVARSDESDVKKAATKDGNLLTSPEGN